MCAAREKDSTVLSFHDSLLRESDGELLNPGLWLNDNIIGFMLEYFEQNEFKDSGITFVSPSVSQLIKLSDASFLEALDMEKSELIFLVINDSDSRTSAGGSHWSLLVYKRANNCFSHYDSFNGNNNSAARDMVKRVKPFLKAENAPTFKVDEKCPQQRNGCDCGVYVISITRHLCKQYLGQTSRSIMDAINVEAIQNMRKHIKELIVQLGAQSRNPSP